MNERIYELIRLSVVPTDQAENYAESKGLIEPSEKLDVARFAELIVEECISVALSQKKWVEDQEMFGERDRDWNKARIQQSQRIVNKIKEHFGVEE